MIYTDNNPLSHLQTAKLGAVKQRWAAELALFNLQLSIALGGQMEVRMHFQEQRTVLEDLKAHPSMT